MQALHNAMHPQRHRYQLVLEQLGLSYDVFRPNADSPLSTLLMQQYDTVLCTTGAADTPPSDSEAFHLRLFMHGGGRFVGFGLRLFDALNTVSNDLRDLVYSFSSSPLL